MEKKDLYLYQSNAVSKTVCRFSNSTTYKLIKYGCLVLSDKFDTGDTMLTLDHYRSLNLMDKNNWSKIHFSDFTVEFSVYDFVNTLDIPDGGKTRKDVVKLIDDVFTEKIMLENGQDLQWFSWFVEGTYSSKTKKISFTFNPGVIGVALLDTKRYTHLELFLIGKLKSIYSLRIYELCKSFYNMKGRYGNDRNRWETAEYSVDFLKEFFGLDKTAYDGRVNNFLTYCIKKPLEELNRICSEKNINLSVSPIVRRGTRNTVKTISFLCEEKDDMMELCGRPTIPPCKDSVDEEMSLADSIKTRYSDRWEALKKEYLETISDNPMINTPNFTQSVTFEQNLVSYISTKYGPNDI